MFFQANYQISQIRKTGRFQVHRRGKRCRHRSPIPEGAEIIEICDSDSLESRDNENLPAR